jgi:hypothetical protein
MKSQLRFTPEVLTCCVLYNHCDYYVTLLVTYERLNILKNDLALMVIYSAFRKYSDPLTFFHILLKKLKPYSKID